MQSNLKNHMERAVNDQKTALFRMLLNIVVCYIGSQRVTFSQRCAADGR